MSKVKMLQEVRLMEFEEILKLQQDANLNCEQAAKLLGASLSTFYRMRKHYEAEGLQGIIDKRLNKISGKRATTDEVMTVTNLFKTIYYDFCVKHFHEKLEKHGVFRSYTWTKNVLQSNGLVERAKKRGTHRRKRPRRPIAGMMLHQDGSTHEWVSGKKWDLIVTMDDATSEIYSIFFVEEEGTMSTFRALAEVIERKGIFCSLYTDRGSHYWNTVTSGDKVDKNNLTQVGRALAQLGIEHIAAYSPEARGRSERMFETLQGRLPQELRLHGITEMDAANRFLRDVYLPEHNKLFCVPAAEEGNAFVPMIVEQLSDILCIHQERTVAKDNTISYKNIQLQIPQDKHRFHYVKCKVMVHEYPNGYLGVFHGPRCLAHYDSKGNLAEVGLKKTASRLGFSHLAAPKEGAKDEGRLAESAPSSVAAPSQRSGCSPAEPYPPDGTYGIDGA